MSSMNDNNNRSGYKLHTKNFVAFFEFNGEKFITAMICVKIPGYPMINKFRLLGTELNAKRYLYSLMKSWEDTRIMGRTIMSKASKKQGLNSAKLHNIAIFIDFPNLDISVRESRIRRFPDVSLIKKYAKKFGKIKFLRVYGDWNLLKVQKVILRKIPQIELINVPHITNGRGAKDLVDTRMAFDIGSTIERVPEISTYIIISGDADFLPVLQQIRMRGKEFLIIAEERSLSSHLRRKFNKIITYQKLESFFIRKSTKQLEKYPISQIQLKLEEVIV